jgi:hypothetical protein
MHKLAAHESLHPTIFSVMKLGRNPALFEPFLSGKYEYTGTLGQNDLTRFGLPSDRCVNVIRKLILPKLPNSVKETQWMADCFSSTQQDPHRELYSLSLEMWYLFNPIVFMDLFRPIVSANLSRSYTNSTWFDNLYDGFVTDLMQRETCRIDCMLRILKLVHSSALQGNSREKGDSEPLNTSKYHVYDVLHKWSIKGFLEYYNLFVNHQAITDAGILATVWDQLLEACNQENDKQAKVQVLVTILDGLDTLRPIVPVEFLLEYMEAYLVPTNLAYMVPGRVLTFLANFTEQYSSDKTVLSKLQEHISMYAGDFIKYQDILPAVLLSDEGRVERWKTKSVIVLREKERYVSTKMSRREARIVYLRRLLLTCMTVPKRRIKSNLAFRDPVSLGGMPVVSLRETVSLYAELARKGTILFTMEGGRYRWLGNGSNLDSFIFIKTIPYFLFYNLRLPCEIWPSAETSIANEAEISKELRRCSHQEASDLFIAELARTFATLGWLERELGWPLIRRRLCQDY